MPLDVRQAGRAQRVLVGRRAGAVSLDGETVGVEQERDVIDCALGQVTGDVAGHSIGTEVNSRPAAWNVGTGVRAGRTPHSSSSSFLVTKFEARQSTPAEHLPTTKRLSQRDRGVIVSDGPMSGPVSSPQGLYSYCSTVTGIRGAAT